MGLSSQTKPDQRGKAVRGLGRQTRVLVTGGAGQLGIRLLALLRLEPGIDLAATVHSGGTSPTIPGVAHHRIDLADSDSVSELFDLTLPDVVIHTASMTDVDRCELEPEMAWRNNVEATRAVAGAIARRGGRLVCVSTDYVFDGRDGPYGENDHPNPLSVYGRTKLIAEEIVLSTVRDSSVVRTSVLFGSPSGLRPNFVTWLLARLQAEQETRVVTDQFGTPTLTDNLAEMVWAVAHDADADRLYHCAGATYIDRYSFALAAAETYDFDTRFIVPIDTATLAQSAARPLRAGLRTDRFRQRYPDVTVHTAADALLRLRRELSNSQPHHQQPLLGFRFPEERLG